MNQEKRKFTEKTLKHITALSNAVTGLKESLDVYKARGYEVGSPNEIFDVDILDDPNSIPIIQQNPISGNAESLHQALAFISAMLSGISPDGMATIDKVRTDY